MRRPVTPLLAPLFLPLFIAACSDDPGEQPPPPTADILDQLLAIEGMTVEEHVSSIEGYRYFVLEYQQPADHDAPDGQRFTQRMALHHRDASAPFVLGSSGYFINSTFQQIREPAQLLGANQLQVEHRFFDPSRPEPTDWSLLTIEQAAADHHRIVEALRPIYSGKWISTGGSKGGMTSIYHRRFFPDDVDGTVAYVAPHSYGIPDPRYLDFVASLGEPDCRQRLQGFQREVLLRRPAMLARMATQAEADGLSYDLLGAEEALDVTAVEFVFGFWQYFDASQCENIPDQAATDDEIWAFLDEIVPTKQWADHMTVAYEPYYWQAATQLGYPAVEEAHLADLLLHPKFDVPTSFVLPGPGKDPVFDSGAMEDITGWLSAEGERILLIYGQNDPYTAAAFELGGAKDAYRFIVPGGNHGARILDLPENDRGVALDALEAWTGVAPVLPPPQTITISPAERWPL
ncbi:S28 family serine protease [Polyangium aurulentum]|uniref:S28 family serine protease n=1 Tax=Polyangium aurulentum TaxID=2567896 RepID=UPI0010ADAE25|nr:S28 family serine protease [Polyangium aurulentum]UQA63343.1 hypothetical protein E8A73_023900 [Polyangium aurulentum]